MARRYTIQVMRGQSIWDIAIQEFGSVEGVFSLIEDNGDQLNGLNDVLVPGMLLRVRKEPVDRDMWQYYKENDLHPVSEGPALIGGAFDNEAWSNDFDNQQAVI